MDIGSLFLLVLKFPIDDRKPDGILKQTDVSLWQILKPVPHPISRHERQTRIQIFLFCLKKSIPRLSDLNPSISVSKTSKFFSFYLNSRLRQVFSSSSVSHHRLETGRETGFFPFLSLEMTVMASEERTPQLTKCDQENNVYLELSSCK